MNSIRTSILLISIILLALCTGCANNNERQQPVESSQTEQTGQIQYTSTVVSKSIKSDKFLIEISGQDLHEFIEVSAILWDRIQVNDTVGFNDLKELVSINNVPVE